MIHLRRLALLLAAVTVASLLVPGIAVAAVPKISVRIVDHPRIVKFDPDNSPSGPYLARTRLDMLWNRKNIASVQGFVRFERWTGSAWTQHGATRTLQASDGNLTVHHETVLVPGRARYRIFWQVDAAPRGGKGIKPFRRTGYGPVASLRAGTPPPPPTVRGKTPPGCLQRVNAAAKLHREGWGHVTAVSGCPLAHLISATRQSWKLERCVLRDSPKCLIWVDQGFKAVPYRCPGHLPRSMCTRIEFKLVPLISQQYRVTMINPTYYVPRVVPYVEQFVIGPNARGPAQTLRYTPSRIFVKMPVPA